MKLNKFLLYLTIVYTWNHTNLIHVQFFSQELYVYNFIFTSRSALYVRHSNKFVVLQV